MAAPKRTKKERETDLYHISAMYCKKMKIHEIIPALENITGSQLSPGMISNDLKVIRQRWAEASIDNMNERINFELAKIDMLESEAYESWQNSKSSKLKVSEKKVVADGDRQVVVTDEGQLATEPLDEQIIGLVERTTTSEQVVGDPRYLEIILKCINRRIQLLGLDAPTRVRVVDPKEPENPEEVNERRAAILVALVQSSAKAAD